jgi:hypothetical protein
VSNERTTINLVVGLLGLAVLFGMGIGGYLAIDGKAVPDFIIATTSGAIGALASLLAQTSSNQEPAPVNVVNDADDPVAVVEAPAPRKAAARKAR